MICSLDDFVFESTGVNLGNIKSQSTYSWESQATLAAFEQWQATGRYKKTLSLAGKLIQQDNDALNKLERIAQGKSQVTLAFEDGRALTVLILSMDTDQSHFLSNGKFLKQAFTVQLAVVYGNP